MIPQLSSAQLSSAWKSLGGNTLHSNQLPMHICPHHDVAFKLLSSYSAWAIGEKLALHMFDPPGAGSEFDSTSSFNIAIEA